MSLVRYNVFFFLHGNETFKGWWCSHHVRYYVCLIFWNSLLMCRNSFPISHWADSVHCTYNLVYVFYGKSASVHCDSHTVPSKISKFSLGRRHKCSHIAWHSGCITQIAKSSTASAFYLSHHKINTKLLQDD